MKLFYVVHAPTGDYFVAYEGMAQVDAENFLSSKGHPFDKVDEATYSNFLAVIAAKPKPVDVALEQAKTTLKASALTNPDIAAIIKVLGI